MNITKKITDCNSVEVAEGKIYREWFCSIKNGRPSTIRDKNKIAKSFNWNKDGLIRVIGHDNFTIGTCNKDSNADFVNHYPDVIWGYAGKTFSNANILNSILKVKNKDNHESTN